MNRRRKILIYTLLGFCGYLTFEAFLPPRIQPSARACLALIDGYQAIGSPAMRETGVTCKYSPSCSHYAAEAIAHYGTVEGCLRAGGRLFRCSPWGGSGYDPAFEEIRLEAQESTPPSSASGQESNPQQMPQRKEGESEEDYQRRQQKQDDDAHEVSALRHQERRR